MEMQFFLLVIFSCILLHIQGLPVENNDEDRIIGGITVHQRGKYPFLVSLQRLERTILGKASPSGHLCGGSILHNRWILTAAHCVLGPTVVVAGTNDLGVKDEHAQIIEVKKFFVHPNFDLNTITSDIALLYLEEDLKFTQYVQPIALPPSNEPAPTFGDVKLIGWGLNNDTGSFVLSNYLREVDGKLRARTGCFNPTFNYFDNSQVCTGYSGRTACKGDSGSPLVQYVNGVPRQIGIASYVSQTQKWICSGDVIYTYPGKYMDSFIRPKMQYNGYSSDQEGTTNKE